jgi:hypothetical protein
MKHLKTYESFTTNENENKKTPYWNSSWEKYLPSEIKIIKGQDTFIQNILYKKGNIMLHSDMVQITYTNQDYTMETDKVVPETLEIDITFANNVNNSDELNLNIDITYGDGMASEFKIHGDKLDVIQYTSYGSKFDPSNTAFAFDDVSLNQFIEFLNQFNGVKLRREQFNFLDKDPNSYTPN